MEKEVLTLLAKEKEGRRIGSSGYLKPFHEINWKPTAWEGLSSVLRSERETRFITTKTELTFRLEHLPEVIQKILALEGVYLAGGAVANLLAFEQDFVHDYDFFLVGKTPEEGVAILDTIHNIAADYGYDGLFQNERCSTWTGDRHHFSNIQVIHRLYSTLDEVLAGFDLGSSQVAASSTEVWFSPRGEVAFRYHMNIVDLTYHSPSYSHRLLKYFRRGFGICFLGYTIQGKSGPFYWHFIARVKDSTLYFNQHSLTLKEDRRSNTKRDGTDYSLDRYVKESCEYHNTLQLCRMLNSETPSFIGYSNISNGEGPSNIRVVFSNFRRFVRGYIDCSVIDPRVKLMANVWGTSRAIALISMTLSKEPRLKEVVSEMVVSRANELSKAAAEIIDHMPVVWQPLTEGTQLIPREVTPDMQKEWYEEMLKIQREMLP